MFIFIHAFQYNYIYANQFDAFVITQITYSVILLICTTYIKFETEKFSIEKKNTILKLII
jgi:hypothetical protein